MAALHEAPPEPSLAPPPALPGGRVRGPLELDASALRSAQGGAPEVAAGRGAVGGIGQLAGFLLLAYLCLFHLSVVRGNSMSPSIHDGDRIVIDPVSYLFGAVARGDIVVLKYPLDPSVDYIKRVIGLPGDEVAIESGAVFVNGERIAEPYVASSDPFCTMRVQVKPAHYFVLGDNRARSCDSREFGQVPQGYVRGKVELRVWPLARVGLIDG